MFSSSPSLQNQLTFVYKMPKKKSPHTAALIHLLRPRPEVRLLRIPPSLPSPAQYQSAQRKHLRFGEEREVEIIMMQLMDRASCSEELSDTSLLTHTMSTASGFACPAPKSWAPCHKHSSHGCLSWRHCNHVPLLAHLSHLDVFMYNWKRACLMTNPFHVLPDWSPLLVQVSSDLSGTSTPATSRGNLNF